MPVEAPRGKVRVVGDYELLEKIADGGMGSVYKAKHRETGDVVAVKLIASTALRNDILLKRFEKEFRAASSFDHPNLVRALDYGEANGTPFLVMEYVDGESLGKRLDRVGRLSEREAIRIIGQAAQGLHKAHKQGLIHRDIKPDNILITSDGRAKVADLGLVKEVDADLNLTRTGRGLGTPHFMAPEQFRNAKNADVRCDIYSLGATLYMAVTGELPFRATSPLDAWMRKMHNDFPTPKQLVPGLSERINAAILRAMSADPNRRPATCREFVEDLTGRSTRRSVARQSGVAPNELWYLLYADESGAPQVVKGSLAAIRRCLKEGRLGDATNIRVCRKKEGPFEPLHSRPEFRDLVIKPAALPVPSSGGYPAVSSRSGSSGSHSSLSGRHRAAASRAPVRRPPPIDIGPTRPPSRQSEWLTWILVLVLLIVGFVVGLYFLGGLRVW